MIYLDDENAHVPTYLYIRSQERTAHVNTTNFSSR